jgi:hypothetical protein
MNKNDASHRIMHVIACSALCGALLAAVSAGTLRAQMGSAGQSGMLQQKLEALRASAAENQQKLHQYTWTQTSQITVNGNARPSQEFTCSYGPDGKVQKIPVGNSADVASGGRGLRGRIIAKRTAEMKEYMQQVGHLISLYLPPDPAKMKQAYEAKNVSLERGGSEAKVVFKDYALPGDSMTVGFDPAAKAIRTLNVRSYLNNPQDRVTLAVEFARLPDGTTHPLRTTLDAQAKKIQVVSTNSNYRKAGQ